MIADILFRGIGVQKLELIEKCQVDILGHISTDKNENEWFFLIKTWRINGVSKY